eukprot:CAMPEP_0174297566 /NCGR_PEP_ID=MMETSP0809-20121228/51378_1 /TAXON_ID=73025 ORGANISM="Eutreptiella gymnastica-like, Strain CCMP1594" /NCGR_SAMPLE_ID=MMETSP0809 /ASSEMBLY_ACC=CAM_ASM_000658 /LENGTH=115 /DNA_ID=CAMNT_0015401443 /DNA_START=107 /DNA_END=454 /DNA_ORIENTATION=+
MNGRLTQKVLRRVGVIVDQELLTGDPMAAVCEEALPRHQERGITVRVRQQTMRNSVVDLLDSGKVVQRLLWAEWLQHLQLRHVMMHTGLHGHLQQLSKEPLAAAVLRLNHRGLAE